MSKSNAMWMICAGLIAGLCALPGASPAQEELPDPWAPVRFMEGTWDGTSVGESGKGQVHRTYEFILKDRYLHEKNTSTYPPQEANKAGEVHEHWSFISYDKQRSRLIFRQFHQEGFVNQYVFNPAISTPTKLVFESESFENFDNSWKARETYELISADEFIETFELGPPGGELEVYSSNHFKRAQP